MIFFIDFIYSFLTPVFLFFILFKKFYDDKSKTKLVYTIVFVSIFAGLIIQEVAVIALYNNEVMLFFRSLSLLAWIVFASLMFAKKLRIYAYYFLAISLFSLAGASYVDYIKDFSFSAANIISSDLIINIAYVFLGIALTYVFAITIKKLSPVHNKIVFYGSFLFIFALSVINLVGEVMLYGIKNEIIEMTNLNLSFVAKATYFDFLFYYAYLFVLAIFTILFYLKRTRLKGKIGLIEARKLKKAIQIQSRWMKTSIIGIILCSFLLSYYDLYASQPPKISTPTMLEPNEQDEFVIPIEDVKDGDLYRYAYITEDGHKVRFFLINRYPDREKVVAVFDACMICGDIGYIKEKNELICIACNVRIFIPSVGKPGGCNPIPFEFTKKDGNVIIKKNAIVEGSRYFSEVVPIEVEDIISKKKLLNTQANFYYEFFGKTFYFENEENMEKFKKDPEKYAPDTLKRRWRTQGHKE